MLGWLHMCRATYEETSRSFADAFLSFLLHSTLSIFSAHQLSQCPIKTSPLTNSRSNHTAWIHFNLMLNHGCCTATTKTTTSKTGIRASHRHGMLTLPSGKRRMYRRHHNHRLEVDKDS